MLRVTTELSGQEIRLRVEGKLARPWVEELRRCWVHNAGIYKGQPVAVDLTGLTFIDAEGKELLGWVHQSGGKLVGSGLMAKSIIEEITGPCTVEGVKQSKAATLKALALVILPLLLVRNSLNAQDKTPLRLTLREAVQIALKENPQVQIANLNLAESEQDRNIARSSLLPQAGFEAVDRATRFNIYAQFGKKFPGIAQHSGPFQFFQAGPNFAMPIFDLTLWRRWQAAHHGVNASEAQQSTVREQVVLLVVSQYLSGLRAGAAVDAARSRVELAQALFDQAQDLQRHGVGTGIDTLRGNVQLQNEKQRLLEAETQQKVALYGLVRLLNLNPDQTVELADQPRFFETPQLEADQSLQKAYETRPEMKTLASQEQIARLQKKGASESRLPSLVMGGGWAYQGLSAPSAIPSYTYQLTVDVPLFTGGRIRSEITRADLEIRKVERQRDNLRDQIALEVKSAIAQLESARHEVDVANLGIKLAQEEVSQARDRFQAGVANNIEVITAQDELARANDNQIGALYRYNQARADVSHAIGQIEELYTK
ncbi:MAG: TolC family protein [Acidobacteriia bacterium]|nr:TolC family protein [Terriglobia bacterium]